MLTRLRFGALYLAWIMLCTILFFALRDTEDPSRRTDRIRSQEAGAIALRILRGRDARQYERYEVVQVAYARAGEGAPEKRWVVLLDAVPHTGLREAVVVEVRAEDGSLLRIRKPLH